MGPPEVKDALVSPSSWWANMIDRPRPDLHGVRFGQGLPDHGGAQINISTFQLNDK